MPAFLIPIACNLAGILWQPAMMLQPSQSGAAVPTSSCASTSTATPKWPTLCTAVTACAPCAAGADPSNSTGNSRNAAITSTPNTGQQSQRKSRTPTGWRYLHLVLTLRNCASYGLSDLLDQLQEAFTRLQRTKAYKDAIQGAYRSIEITRNLNREDPDYLTWHPHVHVLLVVHPSYLERHHKYITHDEWMQLWKRSARVPYGFREPELS